jgi:peptidoglycan lytic transglycosylase
MRIKSSRLLPYACSLNVLIPLFTTVLASLALVGSERAGAKTPGSTYCFYGKCHRVKSIAETEALVGSDETLSASFYDDCKNDRYNPCGLTSSGEVFRPHAPDNAASPIYPDGTTLLVWAPDTKEAAVIRVNNAGPYWGNRKLDVSLATAERLGFKSRGVAKLKVRVIDAPGKVEATYKKYRTYDRVPGYIGQYESLDAAHAGMAAFMGLEAIASSALSPLTGGAVAAAPKELPGGKKPVRVAVAADVAAGRNSPPKTTPTVASSDGTAVDATAQTAKVKVTPEKSKEVALKTTVKKVASSSRPAKAERRAKRNRVAAKKSRRLSRAARVRAAKRARRLAANRGRVTKVARSRTSRRWPGPNDMSVFSRYRKKRGPA